MTKQREQGKQASPVSASPQNPYASFIVQASAGSGKTYQLCRRFLFLVAAGARPAQILTITFTVKAANEMRARIIEEATRLLIDGQAQAEFDQAAALFHQAAMTTGTEPQLLAAPLTASATAKKILAATQALRIATIDAVFKDWVAKFPWEASRGEEQRLQVTAAFGLLEPWEEEELHTQAWLALFKEADGLKLLQAVCADLAELEPGRGVLGLEQRVFELFRHHTYLWQCEAEGQAASAFREHSLGVGTATLGGLSSWAEVLRSVEPELMALAQATRRADVLIAAVRQADLGLLQRERLLTLKLEVSKATLRGKKRDELAPLIARVEEVLAQFDYTSKAQTLNRIGAGLYKLYQAWLALRHEHKRRLGKLEFADLALGCYQIFHGDEGRGATWLIQKSVRHLLIDEFQDTSLLQWGIFKKLSNELLAGAGDEGAGEGVLPTVFVVGDGKQSIYGFREADPIVLTLARRELEAYEQQAVELNHSYRSSATVLNFVNHLFQQYFDPAFPLHRPAVDRSGQAFIADYGRVFVHEPFAESGAGDGDSDGQKAVEAEAAFVADFLAHALAEPQAYPVYDKKNKAQPLRPLRPQDCCLLYRSSKHADEFERALRRRGVPYRREEQRSFFTRPEIKDVLTFLSCLVFPADMVSFLSVARSPLVGLTDADLMAALASLREELGDQAPLEVAAVREYLTQRYPRFGRLLDGLIEVFPELLPHEVVAQLLAETDALQVYPLVFAGDEGQIAAKNLVKLLEVMIELEDAGHTSLQQCVQQLMVLAERNEWGSAAADRNVVTLMTIHKAKGLEFPWVHVVGTGEEWYKLDRYWLKTDGGVSYLGRAEQQPKGSALFQSALERCRLSLYRESIRLLYVALTRASQYLILTASQAKSRTEYSFYPALAATLAAGEAKSHSAAFPGLSYWGQEVRVAEPAASPLPPRPDHREAEEGGGWPLSANPDMPAQIEIVAPHGGSSERVHRERERSEGEDGAVGASVSSLPGLGRLVGVFIHAALEHAAAGKSWDAEAAWQRLVVGSAIARRLDLRGGHWQKIQQEVMLEVNKNLKSRNWQELIAKGAMVATEMPICHLRGGALVRGVIDLYLENEQAIYVVDYKSAPGLGSMRKQDEDFVAAVKRHCSEDGIERQLRYYCEAVAALHPHKRIYGLVWLTKHQEAVRLMTLGGGT